MEDRGYWSDLSSFGIPWKNMEKIGFLKIMVKSERGKWWSQGKWKMGYAKMKAR